MIICQQIYPSIGRSALGRSRVMSFPVWKWNRKWCWWVILSTAWLVAWYADILLLVSAFIVNKETIGLKDVLHYWWHFFCFFWSSISSQSGGTRSLKGTPHLWQLILWEVPRAHWAPQRGDKHMTPILYMGPILEGTFHHPGGGGVWTHCIL